MNATEIDNKAKLLLQHVRQGMRAEAGPDMPNHVIDQSALARAVIAAAAASAERYEHTADFDPLHGIMIGVVKLLRDSDFTADAARNRVYAVFEEAWKGSAETVQ